MPLHTLDQVLACPTLPSLPTVAVELLELTGDKNVQLHEIARVVQNDQALCAKILKTVNSSYYGLSKPCPTMSRALSYLGLNTVKSLVLGFSLVDCTRKQDEGFDLIDYWRRCLYSAAAARRIATLVGSCDPEEAFIAALMQDLGMPAIHTAMGDTYLDVIAQTKGDHDLLRETELGTLGFHHGEAGARLGARWRLPESMVETIRHHDNPSVANAHLQIVQTVALGYYAAYTLIMPDSVAPLARFRRGAGDWFNISSMQATALLGALGDDVRELSSLFQIDTGAAPDVNAILSRAEDASLEHQLAMRREAESLRQTNDDLTRQATTDGLTGAFNRKHFDTVLNERFSQARSFNGCLGLLMIDADKFKLFNDSLGHQAGDAALMETARRIRSAADESAVVCRYGGEEFAVILPGADRRGAAHAAEAIRRAIASEPISLRHVQCGSQSAEVTVSIGAAALEPATASIFVTPQVLVQAADKALYAAKTSGRNCVRVFSAKPTVKAA